MKIPFTNVRLFERSGSSPISTSDLASILRDGVTPYQIQRANAQIHKFDALKQEINRTLELSGQIHQRSYDGAMTTGFNADFTGTFTSANSEIISSDYTVRARARTICKDTPQGKSVFRTDVNNVCGHDPFKLDMRYGTWEKSKSEITGEMVRKFIQDAELNEAIEEEWKIFGQPANYTNKGNMSRMAADRIMEGSAFRDGYIMLRHHRDFPYNEYRYCVELLECDRLQTQYYGKADGSNNPIRFSIEFDAKWNRPVKYWILTMHPGDSFGQSQMAGYNMAGWPASGLSDGKKGFRIGVDAKDIILFNNLMDRAEQDIGFTELDATVQSLWRIFQYEKALTYAAIASCMKVFWYKKNFPTGLTMDPDQFDNLVKNLAANRNPISAPNGGGRGSEPAQRQEGLQPRRSAELPGSTLDLPYGLELMQTDPKFPIEAAHSFRQDNQRDIAVGTGVRYQDVSGDFQNLGFAAALMCSTPAQDNYKVRQVNFIDSCRRPVFREWLKCSIMAGVFDQKYPDVNISIQLLEKYVQAARFKGKRWAFVNPLVQAQTLIIMLEAGIKSPQQVQDELEDGVNIEDLYTMIEESNDEQAKHGIQFGESDVTRPTISKGEPGQSVARPEDQTNTPAPTPTTKPANPVRSRRGKSRIAPETLKLIDGQGDGTSRNGAH